MSQQPRRLSPLTPLVRGAIFVVAVAVTTWEELLAGNLGPFGLVLLAVLGAGFAYGYASWLRTRYWVEGDELRVDTGVVYHQSRRIRVDRLQGIDVVQPFVARLFGLAELKMDVAGGDREGSLAFLPLADAHELRDVLLARRDAAHPWSPPGPGGSPLEQVIARLDLGTLLLSMLLSWETVFLLLGGVVVSLALLVEGTLVVAPGLPVLGGFVLLQLRKLSAYYGFVVAQTDAGLQVRRGLLERSTQTIALARVQGVVVSEPVLWRPRGWARLDVSIAGYGSGAEPEGGPSATTVMPVAPRPLVEALARHLLRGADDQLALSPPARAARWLDPVAARAMAAGTGRDLVGCREGWLTRRTHLVPHARVQSVRLTQGPLQRRLGLADVHVDSPPGPVHVRARGRAAAEARDLLERESALAREARRR